MIYIMLMQTTWNLPIKIQSEVNINLIQEKDRFVDHGYSYSLNNKFSVTAINSRTMMGLLSHPAMDTVFQFLQKLSAASFLGQAKIIFLKGNEPTWTLPMGGYSHAGTAFKKCISQRLVGQKPY